jgi:hypothetical protein
LILRARTRLCSTHLTPAELEDDIGTQQGFGASGGGALIGKRRKMKIVNNKTAPVPTIQTFA